MSKGVICQTKGSFDFTRPGFWGVSGSLTVCLVALLTWQKWFEVGLTRSKTYTRLESLPLLRNAGGLHFSIANYEHDFLPWTKVQTPILDTYIRHL